MPHIWIEYSANLDLDTRALMRAVQDAAVGDGSLYPLAGARTRAVRVDDYLIADGHPDNAFVHVLLRIGHGRSAAQQAALGERTFAALRQALAPEMTRRPLGLSLQVEEADAVLNYKHSNYRDYLAARAAALPRTVAGAALNTRQALAALGEAVNAPPYQAAPRAPVLYIKPANTIAADGDAITLPADVPEVRIGATLGIVFGRRASRVSEAEALAMWPAIAWWPTCRRRTTATSAPRSSSNAATASARSAARWRRPRRCRIRTRSASRSGSTANWRSAPAPPTWCGRWPG